MLSITGALTLLSIMIIPGAIILTLLKKHCKNFLTTDFFCATLVLSGAFNFLFFLPRIPGYYRLAVYLFALFLLVILALYKKLSEKNLSWKDFFTNFFTRESHKKKFSSSLLKKVIYPLIGLMLGLILIGYPFHKLHQSRLQLNPGGGDVQFFLYKTHLLRAGYSALDDVYAGQVAAYPNFPMSQVALATLITGGNMALNAETYTWIVVIIFFWLFYAIGRALTLNENQSLMMALLALPSYAIWEHSHLYLAAGLAFFGTLLFFYFLVRAYLSRDPFIMSILGIAAGLMIFSHMAHGLFGAIVTILFLLFYLCHRLLQKKPLQKIIKELIPFLISGSISALLFLLPLFFKYRFVKTSKWNLHEEFDLTVAQWISERFNVYTNFVALGIIISLIVIDLVSREKIKKFHNLLPAIILFPAVLFSTYAMQYFSIKRHFLAVYIDSGDFYNISSALALTIITIVMMSALAFILKKIFSEKFRTGKIFEIFMVIFVLVIIFPGKPDISFLKSFDRIWNYTKLEKAVGERSLEGNLSSDWDYFAAEAHKFIPLYDSVVLVHEDTMSSLSSNFERQVIIYNEPYSNVFLSPSYLERRKDVTEVFSTADWKKLAQVLKKYQITHIIWMWQNSPEMRELLQNSPFIKEIRSPSWIGVIYEVLPEKLEALEFFDQ